MTPLEQIIQEEITASGAISFARFMELALYHPTYGYYERNLEQTGRNGDFFTSVSVGRLYGELLGFDFARRLAQLPGSDLQLIEAGAHDGRLACDLLNYLRTCQPETFARVQYLIIEPSPRRMHAQATTLAPFHEKLRWVKAWEEITAFRGICFSNELLDAMPVHVFRWTKSRRSWVEWGVTALDTSFHWTPLPASPSAQPLPGLPEALLELLPEDFTIETSPEAVDWWAQAARHLTAGWLIAADYGFFQEELLQPHRSGGTLRTYSRHHLQNNPLHAPGEQDITAHVNFTALSNAGENSGLRTAPLVQQGTFLAATLDRILQNPTRFPPLTPSVRRQIMSLLHPEHFGRTFKFLIQSRNCDP